MKKKPLPIRTLLIVDDDHDLLDVLVTQVSSLGYQTLSADNGEKALALLATSEVHAVLCDLQMPVMDGLELLTRVRQKGNNIPFIFLTGYKNSENLLKAIRLGCYDFIEKPMNFLDLHAVVQRCLDVGTRLASIDQSLNDLSREKPEISSAIKEIQRSLAQMTRLRGKS